MELVISLLVARQQQQVATMQKEQEHQTQTFLMQMMEKSAETAGGPVHYTTELARSPLQTIGVDTEVVGLCHTW